MNSNKEMTFKQFVKWCNDRACDGCGGMVTAMTCIDLHDKLMKIPFWKREKIWKNEYQNQVMNEIVNPINDKITEMKQTADNNRKEEIKNEYYSSNSKSNNK